MTAAFVALMISLAAIGVWLAALVRILVDVHAGKEQRRHVLVMPLVGILAAVGTSASAIGFGIQTGEIHLAFNSVALSVVASMGRGALLMGGLLVLIYYREPGTTKAGPSATVRTRPKPITKTTTKKRS